MPLSNLFANFIHCSFASPIITETAFAPPNTGVDSSLDSFPGSPAFVLSSQLRKDLLWEHGRAIGVMNPTDYAEKFFGMAGEVCFIRRDGADRYSRLFQMALTQIKPAAKRYFDEMDPLMRKSIAEILLYYDKTKDEDLLQAISTFMWVGALLPSSKRAEHNRKFIQLPPPRRDPKGKWKTFQKDMFNLLKPLIFNMLDKLDI